MHAAGMRLAAFALTLLLLPTFAAAQVREHWDGAGEGMARVSTTDCGAAFVLEIDRTGEDTWNVSILAVPTADRTQPFECIFPFSYSWSGVPGSPQGGWEYRTILPCGDAYVNVGRLGVQAFGATEFSFVISGGCGGEYGRGIAVFVAEDAL